MFRDKKRETVIFLFKAIYNPHSSGIEKVEGITIGQFRTFVGSKYVNNYLTKKKTKGSIYMDELALKHCIEDGYISCTNLGRLQITSKGMEFVDWKYIPKQIINYWLTKAIITNIVAFLVGLLLGKLLK